MKASQPFELKNVKNFSFRFKALPATELVALQTQLNFDDFEKAKFATNYILEHTEVKVAESWLPVKESHREVYNPEGIADNVKAMNELITLFLTIIITPLFQNSNG